MIRCTAVGAGLALASLAALAPDAHACGGCFVPESVNTQVSSHRMVLSLSNERTSLWDQIVYVGEPESFAWVLPTRGVVEVGLSSDAMFQALESMTVVTVLSPPACGVGNGSPNAASEDSAGGSEPPSKSSDEESVEVTAHEVVGPYETVQLSSEDPAALRAWLEDHGYAIPEDVAPLIDDYVAEGFDFLALRLVPGEGVDAMQPVRVTTPGALAALPLRMVAAGTGARTPISLWVVGEGRYQAANMDNFLIQATDVIWDWDTSSSNYAVLRDEGFAATDQRGWLTEVVLETRGEIVTGQIEGFANASAAPAYDSPEQLAEDTDALVGDLDPDAVVVTRLAAELSKEALAQDLLLEASPDQSAVPAVLQTTKTIGTEPTCGGGGGDDGIDDPLGGSCDVSGYAARRDPLVWALGGLVGWIAWRSRRRSFTG